MKAILSYVQRVIASSKDGTISLRIDTGEIGSITVKNRSIVAATLNGHSGKEALEAIKLAVIVHMEFWTGILLKSDIQRMMQIQSDTHEISPIPEEELYPEGATLPTEPIDMGDSSIELNETEPVSNSSSPRPLAVPPSEHDIEALTKLLTSYIGPAAELLAGDAAQMATNTDDLIRRLSKDLFEEDDVAEFIQKAYYVLGLE